MNNNVISGALEKATAEKPPRILVLDGSRVVRATLAKRLAGHFEIVEEGDGESAWQRLMLDGRIAAVISGISPPRLVARDLLARLRRSAMQRLKIIPFILIVSDLENPAGASADDLQGVTGFITKSMSKEAMTAQLNRLLGGSATLQRPEAMSWETEMIAAAPSPAPLLDDSEFAALLAAFPLSVDESACLLVLGIDQLDELTARFGKDVPEILTERIAGLLAGKLHSHDRLGRCGRERLAIVSQGADVRQVARFATRVCASLASGQIAIQGQKLKLTVSIGIAGSPEDKVDSGGKLLALAQQRMEQAMLCGGNAVCTELRPDCPLHCHDAGLLKLLRALQPGEEAADSILPEQIGTLGIRVFPLLQKMDEELSLGLPLEEIRKRLQQRAQTEKSQAV